MRVRIDRPGCIGCSLCWTECPEVFEQDPDDSLSRLLAPLRVGGDPGLGEAPEILRSKAESAAAGCPVGVISVE